MILLSGIWCKNHRICKQYFCPMQNDIKRHLGKGAGLFRPAKTGLAMTVPLNRL